MLNRRSQQGLCVIAVRANKSGRSLETCCALAQGIRS